MLHPTVTTPPASPNFFFYASPMSGTYTVGPTGNFLSLTAAANSVVGNGVTAPVVLELQPTYLSAVETFPLAVR